MYPQQELHRQPLAPVERIQPLLRLTGWTITAGILLELGEFAWPEEVYEASIASCLESNCSIPNNVPSGKKLAAYPVNTLETKFSTSSE